MPPSPVSLADVSAGHTFPPIPVDLSTAAVGRLLRSLDAEATMSSGGAELVPPSAAAALALGALLTQFGLPPGAVHASQQIRMVRPTETGTAVMCIATVSAVSTRGATAILTLDFTLTSAEHGTLAEFNGVLMFPAAPAPAMGAPA